MDARFTPTSPRSSAVSPRSGSAISNLHSEVLRTKVLKSRLSQWKLKTSGDSPSPTKKTPQSVAPSVVGSLNEKDEKGKKAKAPIVIWPEWTEQDIGQEKWDTSHKPKEKEKGKSPNLHPYEDPEGRIDLPSSIKSYVDHWKKPVEFMLEKSPVVVDPKSLAEEIDLLSVNDHLTNSELLRCIIGQVMCLWKLHFKVDPIETVKGAKDTKESNKADKERDKEKDKDRGEKDKDALLEDNTWKPWNHIWPKEKTKGSPLPVYNPGGKYCVRIFWMGTWRKVTVDDWMPFDEDGKLMLPASPNEHELWPMLLSKALIKVASLDYAGGYNACEFGDFTVVHALTGWMPEIIPLRCGHTGEIWKLLLQTLPRWKLENTPPPEEKKQHATECRKKDDRDKERKSTKSEKSQVPEKVEREKEKKEKEKEKDKATPAANLVDVPKEPEFVIFASYSHPPNMPMRHSVLKEMADASEKLRQSGLSHNHPHPVLLTTVRDCPLVPPPPPVQIPRWKLIRQKKKKQPVEPALTPPEPPKDPQFLEVVSPFLNHKVSPIPVSRAKTPVRWLKYRPEKPMGEILEEGDKDNGEKTEGGEGEDVAEKTSGEKREGLSDDGAAVKEDEKSKTSTPRLENDELKPDQESKESRESLRDRPSTKDSTKSKEREKSAKSDKGEKDKLLKSPDKSDKSRSGSKLSVVDKPERTKSGGLSPKSSRRMSRMEKPGDLIKTPPETRRMSRVEKGVKIELERDSSHKVEAIRVDELPVLDLPGSVAEGDKVPADGTDGETTDDKTEGDKTEDGDKVKENINKDKKIWMEYADFCKCFRHLYIFHKPNTYNYCKGNSELKSWVFIPINVHHHHQHHHNSVTSERKMSSVMGRRLKRQESEMSLLSNVAMTSHVSKKSGLIPASSVTATTPAPGKATGLSPSPYHGSFGGLSQNQDPPPPFLFVDSLKPIEIVVSFTAFSRWLDPPQPVIRERDKEKEKEKDSNSIVTADPREAAQVEEKPVPPTPGLLVAEPYSWKSLVTGQPILRIRTSGTKAAVLVLPPGRHVLRFLVQAPHGYHVEMASQTPFVYGDEDTVMTCLTKESCRFLEHAMNVFHSVSSLVGSFADPPADRKFDLDLGLKDQTKDIQDRHYKVFMRCLLKSVRFYLADSYDLPMHFAWKAFQFQASLCLHQRVGHRPLSAAEITRIGSMTKKRAVKSAGAVPPTWVDRTSNSEEEGAATKIQAAFRGYFLRKLARAYVKGTDEHQKVWELLSKAWGVIEPNLESFAIQIFRFMFKRDSELFPLFPFFKDEWSRVAYSDYNGGYPEQPPQSWFVVFREVFFVDELVLMVPKLYVTLPTCLLRVVDNDSGEELTRVFQKVAPNNLKKNKRGYTFVAEARTPNAILPAGKFRLRVIGSTEPLPYPGREGVNSHFVTKEIRDYYIPNKYSIIFRYTVKVQEDHMASLQLGTSKPDVYIKLQILDHEQEVCSTTGKSHAVIPAFTFYRDRTGDEDEKQKRGSRPPTSSHPRSAKRPPSGSRKAAASPMQGKGGKKSGKESSNSSRPGSSQKGSRPLLCDDSEDKEDEDTEDTEPEIKIHKYIIQAQVLRDSWPLSKSAWDFVALIKSLDRLDVEVPTESAPRGDKLSASVSKGKKNKEGKESRSSKGQAGSRPSSQQQFDSSKPNWTLRIVSDASAEEIEVKKDTERQDEIKAMKLAWEAAEPGRAAKAQQSRQKFLNEHMVKVEKDAIEEENGDEEQQEEKDVTASSEILTVTSPVQSESDQGELTLVPPPKEPDHILQPLSEPKTIRSRGGVPVLLDEEEIERRLLERKETLQAFKTQRKEVENRREQDRLDRNTAKERQLQEAEELQAATDKWRGEVNQRREAYRQKFLEAEKQKEEAQAAEAAKERERSPSPSKSRKSASTAKGGRKSPAKGKKK